VNSSNGKADANQCRPTNDEEPMIINSGNKFGKCNEAAFRPALEAAVEDVNQVLERHGDAICMSTFILVVGCLAAQYDIPLANIVNGIESARGPCNCGAGSREIQ
jgi:hypothetical protein